MTSAYVLIAAVLVLGGLLAALGDRLGSKIGKARLRLFNLRPKQTAVLVTILTGTAIAGSTLGILFATSESLRKGIFRLDEYLNQLRQTQKELNRAMKERDRVEAQKQEVETELQRAQRELDEVQARLDRLNGNFQTAREQLERVSEQVTELRQEILQLNQAREQLNAERDRLQTQISQRDAELETLENRVEAQQAKIASQEQRVAAQAQQLEESETRLARLELQRNTLQAEIQKRDERIATLDRTIAERNQALSARENRLNQLLEQITFLRQEVASLEQYYQYYLALRQGNVAIRRGQILSFNVVQVFDPSTTPEIVDRILQETNKIAAEAIYPGTEMPQEQVILITRPQVEELRQQIKDGKSYVVQMVAASNYLRGEDRIRVIAEVIPNRPIFDRGEVLASVSLNSGGAAPEEIRERLDILLASSTFRARRAGVLGSVRLGGDSIRLIRFLEQLDRSEIEIEQIQAVALETTYTAGPLELQLVALNNGKVVIKS